MGILIGCAIAIVLPTILIQLFGYGVDEAKTSAGDASLVNEQGQPAGGAGKVAATPVASADAAMSAISATAGADAAHRQTNVADLPNEEYISAPLIGKIVPLTEVPDEAFSSGAMGQGLAIEPSGDKLYAPFDGTVATVAPTGHAIGLRSDTGVELFVHIGLDTVKLKGAPFNLQVKEGDTFQKGDQLLQFDKALIQSNGMPTITPVLVTNSYDYKQILVGELDQATTDADILTVIR